MLTTHLDAQTRTLYIAYPQGSRIRPQLIDVSSYDHAARVLEINTVKYMASTLARWVKQREMALTITKRLTQKHAYAIDRLKLVLQLRAESRIGGLVAAINRSAGDITLIAPPDTSSHSVYYQQIITPIINWCRQHTAPGHIIMTTYLKQTQSK